MQSKKESERVPLRLPSVGVLGLGFYTQSRHAVSGADVGAGEKLFLCADLARLWLHIECRTLFGEKRDFGRLRSWSYSREWIETSFLKDSLYISHIV